MTLKKSYNHTLQEKTLLRFLNPTQFPKAFYDLGVGLKSEAESLKRAHPELDVFGCEPCPQTYNQIVEKFPGKLFPQAVFDKAGPAILNVPVQPMQSSLYPLKGTRAKPVEVECITLDQFDALAGMPDSVILWMDIQGSELPALKSGPKLLGSGRVKLINLEIVTYKGYGWPMEAEVHEFLEGAGYVCQCRYSFHGETHYDAIYTLEEGS